MYGDGNCGTRQNDGMPEKNLVDCVKDDSKPVMSGAGLLFANLLLVIMCFYFIVF